MGLLRRVTLVLGAALALLMSSAIVAQQATDDGPAIMPAKGTWQGQTSGNKLTIDPASNGLYVARAPQTPTEVVSGVVYVRGKHGRFRSKPPAGDGSIIDVLGPDQIRVTRPDGTAEIFSRIVAGATANALPLDPVSGQPEPRPIDPVSGLAIPMLPGQFAVKTRTGCWMITDSPSTTSWARDFIFRGPCKYGVIDGPGQLLPTSNVNSASSWQKAELGDFDHASYREFSVPRTSAHDLYEEMSIYRRTLEEDDNPAFGSIHDRNGSFATHVFLQYDAYTGRTHTEEVLHFLKVSCRGFRGARKMDQATVYDEFDAKSPELARVVKFCDQAVTRLRAEQPGAEDFDHVDYGYFFETSLDRKIEVYSADGSSAKAVSEKTTAKLCPTINSIVGCDAVWQGMLAPYVSRFETLKPQQAKLWAQHRAERKARFAPLAAAWRAKIAQLAQR
jgi:hypothetical protein